MLRYATVCVMAGLVMGLAPFAAEAGRGFEGVVARFERHVGDCQESLRDATLNSCLAKALHRLSGGLRAHAAIASEAAPAVAKASAEMAATKTRPAAVSVLDRGLAAKISKGAAEADGHLTLALMRAQAAIAAGGDVIGSAT